MPTTIRDVAERLQLSITTVSRAMDGYADVAEDTRQRVVAMAAQMGYTPNRAARQLRRQRSDTLGYILPARQPQFSDPFFSEFIAGLGDEVAVHNFDLLVSTAPPATETERQIYGRWAHGHKVDGFILNRMRLNDWRVQYLAGEAVPFVSHERSLDEVDFVGVEVDTRSGLLELIAHLHSLGHCRIAYIGGPAELKIQNDRFSGYCDGLGAMGLTFDAQYVADGDLTPAGGYAAAGHLLALATPPTAIVCINDLTAFGVLHAAHERHLPVGKDLAVAGFDGLDDSQHTQPPLTTIDQPVYDIARTLVRQLIALIIGEPLPERRVHLRPRLLIRSSTGD